MAPDGLTVAGRYDASMIDITIPIAVSVRGAETRLVRDII